ncbi:MAG: O-antigen ligase family protein [Acidobacteriota bacterium]|nr:MAG: O-antigen ligase family protein [Acidobacteriota bacterium]
MNNSEHHRTGNDSPGLASTLIFVLLIAVPVAANLSFGGVSTGSFAFITALVGLIPVLWLVHSFRSGRLTAVFHPALFAFAGLIVLGLFQLLPLAGSGVPDGVLTTGASNALSVEPNATRLAVIKLFVFGVFFFAALTFIDSRSRIRTLVIALIIFGSAMAFFAILQSLSDPTTIYGITPAAQARPFGSFINRHHFASFLVMMFAMALAPLAGGGTKRDKLVFFAIGVILIGTGVIFAGSRGAFLSLVAVLSFLAVSFLLINRRDGGKSSRNERRPLLGSPALIVGSAVGLMLVLILFAVWAGGEQELLRGAAMQEAGEDFSTGRLHYWSVALKIFAANPIIGSGLESFGVAFTRYDTWSGIYRVEHAHNDYLQMLSDGGIVGLALVLVFIYFLFRSAIGTIRGARDRFRRSAAVGALAGCFGVMVHSFVDFPLRTNANMFFFLLLAVMAIGKVNKD